MDRSVNEDTLAGVKNATLAMTGDEAAAEKARAAAHLADKMAQIESEMQ